ncbi:MAG TPA: hypothetical protein VK858_10370 [Longimicrobiales bacterium]|nr:hypothetical protein [Longimicrobiales bacterium]
MRIVATRKDQQNKAVTDPWTVVHFSTGLAIGLMGIPLRWTLPLAAVYEVVEQLLERKRFGQELFKTSGPETLGNAIVDVGVFAAGHRLGEAWNSSGERHVD